MYQTTKVALPKDQTTKVFETTKACSQTTKVALETTKADQTTKVVVETTKVTQATKADYETTKIATQTTKVTQTTIVKINYKCTVNASNHSKSLFETTKADLTPKNPQPTKPALETTKAHLQPIKASHKTKKCHPIIRAAPQHNINPQTHPASTLDVNAYPSQNG